MEKLDGVWEASIGDGRFYEMHLPGTLDESGIGHADYGGDQRKPETMQGPPDGEKREPIATRFTRKYSYEGAVMIKGRITVNLRPDRRYFIDVERARHLTLTVNGKEVSDFVPPSLSTPRTFEVTGALTGEDEIQLVSDNSYPGWPRKDIVYASAATDETQTNWNGLLGEFSLREEPEVFLKNVRIYPHGEEADVFVDISAAKEWEGNLRLHSNAFATAIVKRIQVAKGEKTVVVKKLPLAPNAERWELWEDEAGTEEIKAKCHEVTVLLEGMDEKKVSFGIRTFGDDGTGRLAINGRRFFLRGEANCAVFPETGYPPMEKDGWLKILKSYQAYGVNCMRFHSWCPPDAAFRAADELGMLMQPELSCWNPEDAFETEERFNYYCTELKQILLTYANHPSFVMLTFGNELKAGELGHDRMNRMLALAHELDDTRLFANGSNVHYGEIGCDPESDFYTSQKFYEEELRGTFAGEKDGLGIRGYINNRYPSAKVSFDEVMAKLRKEYKKPVFNFEVGQYEILPDFDELTDYHGVTEPLNYKLIQERVEGAGLTKQWKAYVEATGELSRICYREEVESVMRTGEMSGISLLGLQDFPGQGTALVGMLNAHLEPKPFAFADASRFRSFFCSKLPLVLLPKYTYTAGEKLTAEVKIANYGREALEGAFRWSLRTEGEDKCEVNDSLDRKGCLVGHVIVPSGELVSLGNMEIQLPALGEATKFILTVEGCGISNSYPVWVYPCEQVVCPSDVYETCTLDATALEILQKGGKVYLSPDSTKEAIPASIRAQFSPDFWSVGTFEGQEGAMGQLIDASHPIFRNFPTESHTDWQWWPMAVQRAFLLPGRLKTIITEMDSYAYLRPMAQLLEAKCLRGRIVISSMGLQNLQQYPEARALQNGIYRYMASDEFLPEQTVSVEELEKLFTA